MQNKIRLAQEQKVPYMLVLGDREVEARTASPRTRSGEQQPAEEPGWEALAERLATWRTRRQQSDCLAAGLALTKPLLPLARGLLGRPG